MKPTLPPAPVKRAVWLRLFSYAKPYTPRLLLGTFFGILFGAYSVLRINFAMFLIWLIVWALCVERALAGKRFRLPLLAAIAEKQARL